MDNISIRLIAFIVLTIGILSCSDSLENPAQDNPLDPNNPSFIPPLTSLISGPSGGETLDTANVTFTWRGNREDSEFSYRLGGSEWSDWSDDTTVSYTYLDELEYEFEVKSRYPSGFEEEQPQSINFIVNAVQGPSFVIFNRHNVVEAGKSFTVNILAEEVEDLFAAQIIIDYNPLRLEVIRVVALDAETDFLRQNDADVIMFSEFDNQTGQINIDLGIWNGDPAGVSGTGAMIEMHFNALDTGSTLLRFNRDSQMRSPDNISITINEFPDGLIEIE